jgi:hypothetical protein
VLLHPGSAVTIGDVELCSNQENDACLRLILRELLAGSAPATVSEALVHVAAGRGEGPIAVRVELQTALVPLNRGAARRALARLYRKLTNAGAEIGVEAEPPIASEHGVARRAKRRGAAFVPDEIPVAVDETAFRVASRSQELAPAKLELSAKPESEVRSDSRAMNWYPAQTTPWQFQDRAVKSGEGTPILGSVLVRDRDVSEAPSLAVIEVMQPHIQSLGNITHRMAPIPANTVAAGDESDVAFDEWVDTFVDAPVALVGEATEAAPTFNPRRSRVAELVQRMPAAPYGLDMARKNLLDLVNDSNDEPEFLGLGTVTPPPVAQDAPTERPSPSRRGPRRIVLSTLAAGAALSAWLTFTSHVDEDRSASVAAPRSCEASVLVEVPKSAKVFLNDARERAAQSGPLARFDAVPCGGQAEVTVQVPSADGSPLPDAWVRMPLPEVELRASFESGNPLIVTPLGDHD